MSKGLSIFMPEFIEIVNENFKHNIDIIVEVGCLDAKDGLLLKKSFNASRLVVIEALPDNYETFLKGSNEFEPHCIAITNYNGVTKFNVKTLNGIHGIFDRGSEYGTEVIEIPCMTLDSFCEQQNITNIDVLKIDTEGGTLEVLEGMTKILPNVGIMHIETESEELFKGQRFHGEVVKFLKDRGFTKLEQSDRQITQQLGAYQHDTAWINNKI